MGERQEAEKLIRSSTTKILPFFILLSVKVKLKTVQTKVIDIWSFHGKKLRFLTLFFTITPSLFLNEWLGEGMSDTKKASWGFD